MLRAGAVRAVGGRGIEPRTGTDDLVGAVALLQRDRPELRPVVAGEVLAVPSAQEGCGPAAMKAPGRRHAHLALYRGLLRQ